MMNPPITSEKTLKDLSNLQTKIDSKSWIDLLTAEDIKILEDALYAANALTAQCSSWNELHQHITDVFKMIVDMFNSSIVFEQPPTPEDEQQNG